MALDCGKSISVQWLYYFFFGPTTTTVALDLTFSTHSNAHFARCGCCCSVKKIAFGTCLDNVSIPTGDILTYTSFFAVVKETNSIERWRQRPRVEWRNEKFKTLQQNYNRETSMTHFISPESERAREQLLISIAVLDSLTFR